MSFSRFLCLLRYDDAFKDLQWEHCTSFLSTKCLSLRQAKQRSWPSLGSRRCWHPSVAQGRRVVILVFFTGLIYLQIYYLRKQYMYICVLADVNGRAVISTKKGGSHHIVGWVQPHRNISTAEEVLAGTSPYEESRGVKSFHSRNKIFVRISDRHV